MRREILLVGGVLLGSLGLIVGLTLIGTRAPQPIEDVTTACVQHSGIGMHVHARLKILIDGEERVIPPNIGIVGPRCMRPLHTHDDSGTLHLEFPVRQDVRLGQFFEVWKQPFSKERLLDRTLGDRDVLRVTVNGSEVQELQDLLLHDRDEVVIEVKKPGA